MDFRVTIQLKVKWRDSGDAHLTRIFDPWTYGIYRFEDKLTMKVGWREEEPYNSKWDDCREVKSWHALEEKQVYWLERNWFSK